MSGKVGECRLRSGLAPLSFVDGSGIQYSAQPMHRRRVIVTLLQPPTLATPLPQLALHDPQHFLGPPSLASAFATRHHPPNRLSDPAQREGELPMTRGKSEGWGGGWNVQGARERSGRRGKDGGEVDGRAGGIIGP